MFAFVSRYRGDLKALETLLMSVLPIILGDIGHCFVQFPLWHQWNSAWQIRLPDYGTCPDNFEDDLLRGPIVIVQ